MKFLVDAPLGGLAKWLRFCGFDAELLRLAADVRILPLPADDVYLLTANAAFKKLNRPDLLVLAAPDPGGQLEEVIRRFRISPQQFRPLSRCSHCNEKLVPLDRDQALGRVPEHVFNIQRQFFECPRCHRVYWPGSHLADLTGKIRQILEQAGSSA
jgi:uncharacterized protein